MAAVAFWITGSYVPAAVVILVNLQIRFLKDFLVLSFSVQELKAVSHNLAFLVQ